MRDLGARLVVIDPVSAALADVDTAQTGPVRSFLRALTAEATAAGAGVLLVAHDTKAARDASRRGDDAGAGVVAGSAAWFDGARGVLSLVVDPEPESSDRLLTCVKANYGRTGWGARLTERTRARWRVPRSDSLAPVWTAPTWRPRSARRSATRPARTAPGERFRMETCRVSDRPTLETAESGAAVLEALARAIWAKRHDGAECPADRIPAPVDLFRWLPECPPSAWDEVTAAELAHGPGAVAWLSNVADVLTAANAPLRGGTFVLEHALADCLPAVAQDAGDAPAPPWRAPGGRMATACAGARQVGSTAASGVAWHAGRT